MSVMDRPVACSRLRELPDPGVLPALQPAHLPMPLWCEGDAGHAPRILLLYGSLRERSYSRLATEEAARLLQWLGAETRIFDPRDLPFPDQAAGDDRSRELRAGLSGILSGCAGRGL